MRPKSARVQSLVKRRAALARADQLGLGIGRPDAFRGRLLWPKPGRAIIITL